eukprot:m.96786 g.96786  ORF g.96786 m.96786 type:complete len:1097 (-) comp13559_c0_seq1:132-3422(-)
MSSPEWTAIVLTSKEKSYASMCISELQKRQAAGFISEKATIIAVEDPAAGVHGVGSGGATLNAMLVVTEHLSALKGQTVADFDNLLDARILVLHMGGSFTCDPLGKAFTTFAACRKSPNQNEELLCNVDCLLETMERLRQGAPPGVWICSTEMLLSLSSEPLNVDWSSFQDGIRVVAVKGSSSYAAKHGVYKLKDGSDEVLDLLYKAPEKTINDIAQKDGSVFLVSGIVFLCPQTCEKLLALTIVPPLNACTYLGLDDGASPFKMSLFLDIVRYLCPGQSQAESSYANGDLNNRARNLLQERMVGTRASAIILENAEFVYMPKIFKDHALHLFAESPLRRADVKSTSSRNVWSKRARTFIRGDIPDSCVVINSVVGSGVTCHKNAVLIHSHLNGLWSLDDGCYIQGLDDTTFKSHITHHVQSDIALQQFRIKIPRNSPDEDDAVRCIFTVFGLNDQFESSNQTSDEPIGTFCNEPWDNFFSRTLIETSELWAPGSPKTVSTALLFPVAMLNRDISVNDVLWMQPQQTPSATDLKEWRQAWRVSIETILSYSDPGQEQAWRHTMSQSIGLEVMQLTLNFPSMGAAGKKLASKSGLTESAWCLLPFFTECSQNPDAVFSCLDKVASETSSPGIAARALACCADMLGTLARGRGGLRSGPGRNQLFQDAFEHLETGNVKAGIKEMSVQRKHWMRSPELLIRAARHYESAAQILIRHAVMSARQFINTSKAEPMPLDKFMTVESAARIDLSGGWTDTPPIAYEHGGSVTNAAILINGKRPIGAKVKRIPELMLKLVMGSQVLEINHLDDLRNYTQPQAPGALLKAAFCCADIVSIDSDKTLQEQLKEAYGSGFELHTWSNLPTGSGLGTSSILAGVVMAGLWKCSGVKYEDNDLVHAVLHLEQMLTTGGGWQDQVGGLVGGVKIARSPASLPLHVQTELIPLEEEFLNKFSDHLVLIYTGKTRLARNLLQNVVRNWYARDPALVNNADLLCKTSEECYKAFQNKDLEKIGKCLDLYWEQKKFMAPGCEPGFVKKMMQAMKPHAYGQSMAGAGGGGYMYVITKEPHMSEKLEALVRKEVEGMDDVEFAEVKIDNVGLHYTS